MVIITGRAGPRCPGRAAGPVVITGGGPEGDSRPSSGTGPDRLVRAAGMR
jgi:hypothetical protein